MSKSILDADTMLARAQMETGLGDWGDDTLPERFRLAVEIFKEKNLNEAGQRATREVANWMLTDRLRLFEDFKKYPIGEEKIEKPLFGTGEARSGTTLLHALLAVDPHGRALRFWEVSRPSPPPGIVQGEDPRRALGDDDWRDINTKLPFWLVSHPYNDMLGDGLPEDERTWDLDFRRMTTTGWWRAPIGMINGRLPENDRAQMRIHKMMLQQFQYKRPKKYWVLKGFHGQRLRELFDIYPDARIIWSHRDPVQTAASITMLIAELQEGLTGSVDIPEQAKVALARTRANIKDTLTDPMVNDPRIHHIRYPDFVKDPVGSIHGFYEFAGVPWKPDTEQAMRDYLKNNRGDRYGKFKYSASVLGEDIDALNKEFAPFRERFKLEIEKR